MIYKMTLADSSDTMTFDLLEVPIADKDVEGAVDNTLVNGNVFTDYLWLKKQFIQKWSIMCPDEYDRLRGFYTRQWSNATVPTYYLFYGVDSSEKFSLTLGDYQLVTNDTQYDAPLSLDKLYGNTTQTTYTGKNLIPLTDVNMSDSGSRQNDFNVAIPAGTYTVSFNLDSFVLGANASFGINLRLAGEGTASVGDKTIVTIDSTTSLGYKTYTFSISSPSVINTSYPSNVRIGVTYWNNGARAVISNMQLEAGSTASAFEPYVGGIPSPNPDYPQAVQTVTGEQTVSIVNRNLIDTTNLSSNTSGGVTTTWSGNIGTSSGTTASTSALATASIDFATPLPAGSYTFSVQSASTHAIVIALYNPSTSSWISTTMAAGTKTKLVTTDFTATRWRIGYSGLTANTSFSDTITQPMLEYGSTATDDYEPYQRQTYGINLGKNLMPALATGTTASGGITWTITDSTITGSGLTSSTTSGVGNNMTLPQAIPVGTYTFSIPQALAYNIRLTLVKADGSTSSNFTITAGNTSATVTTTFEIVGVRPVLAGLTSGTQIDISFPNQLQIEAGYMASEFAPYFTPIELAKIGTYQDYIWDDNGTWKIHKETGKQTFTGSENWGLVSNSSSVFYIDNVIQDFATSNNVPMSDYFLGASNVAGNAGGRDLADNTMAFMRGSSPVRLYIRASQFNNVIADFKTWLSTHNIAVYYALETPTDTAITNTTLVAQLDALQEAYLYVGKNNLYLTPSGGAQGSADFTYEKFYSKATPVIPTTAVRLTLTDDGVINPCGCRRNVQLKMRETVQ